MHSDSNMDLSQGFESTHSDSNMDLSQEFESMHSDSNMDLRQGFESMHSDSNMDLSQEFHAALKWIPVISYLTLRVEHDLSVYCLLVFV